MGTQRAIVIGTGAGGLAAAGYLAKAGFDVLALEQAEQLGGYLNPFVRDGFHFDTGLHYVGQARPGQMLHGLLAGLGIDAEALLCELDPDGFDVYRFPGFEIRNCRGLERFRDRLIERFPHEARGLRRFFKLVARSGAGTRLLAAAPEGKLRLEDLAELPSIALVLRLLRRTYADVLRACIADHRARAVLAAMSGNYGLPPSRAAALIGLGVLGHYADGAFYPRGGDGAFRDALVAAAVKYGARFRTSAHVRRILSSGGRVHGVELVGGERIDADVIVSDADPVLTFGTLLEPSSLPRAQERRIRRVDPSIASFGVYLGMRRDLRAHGLGAANVWDYPDWDVELAFHDVLNGRLPEEPLLFLSPSSLKDASGTVAPAGCSTLEIVTIVPYALFEHWSHLAPAQRGSDYAAEKERVAAWVLSAVERRWPGLVGDVVVREISTPLTNESYTMAIRGGMYGPAQTPEQSGPWRFRTTTPIAHLFLAGAGVVSGGVASCLASGRAAAMAAARALAPERARGAESAHGR